MKYLLFPYVMTCILVIDIMKEWQEMMKPSRMNSVRVQRPELAKRIIRRTSDDLLS